MERQVITTKDIQSAFEVNYQTACHLIREIKSISDIAGLKGKILIADYERWMEVKSEQQRKN